MAIMAKAFASRISRWSFAVVLTLGSLVWISLNLWTAPIGLLWHISHGRFASFGDRRIAIPWDMWVDRGNHGIVIVREAAKHRLLNSPWGTIVLTQGTGKPTSLPADYDRIARSEEQLPEGFRLQVVREVRARKRRGYCWESSRVGTSELMISCHFQNDTFSAALRGSSSYSHAFYEAISAD